MRNNLVVNTPAMTHLGGTPAGARLSRHASARKATAMPVSFRLCALALLLVPHVVHAQVTVPLTPKENLSVNEEQPHTWLDRTQQRLYELVWHTARNVDGWMGRPLDDTVYQQASGSIAFAMLYDQFDGFDPKVRFHVNLPLPQLNKRMHLFIGRVNRDEFVTERDEPSGAFPDERPSSNAEDQTLAGLVYTQAEHHGGSFSAGGGARIKSGALDPYIKTAYRYRHTLWDDTLFTAKETLFYQVSERFGLTTRLDLERLVGDSLMLRWTGSGTVSQGTDGMRGYSALTATRALPGRQALISRISIDGDTSAEVPLHQFGVKIAYRRSVIRDWLVMEVRTSLSWPKELRGEPRKPSWGLGIGCEMTFGTEEFSNEPVTF